MLILPAPKPCPKCDRQMISEWFGGVLLTSPAQHPWRWWCGCGNTEVGGVITEESREQERMRRWEQVNKA